VRLVQAWPETARIVDGPVFRSLDTFQRVQPRRLSHKAVVRVIKRRAAAVGLDPARYAGDSLRGGLATGAAAGGAPSAPLESDRPQVDEYGPALHPRGESVCRR
jgi:hypothetical protein